MMRKFTFVVFIVLPIITMSTNLLAQVQELNESTFDFWVGDWELTWQNAIGEVEKGANHIERTVGGKVIQEHFSDEKGKFLGTSISVFNPQNKTWHQAWADNSGGYYNFVGGIDGNKKMFSTQMKEVDNMRIIQRMVFYNLKEDSFTWDWELSKDGGTTWELQWRINYKRKN